MTYKHYEIPNELRTLFYCLRDSLSHLVEQNAHGYEKDCNNLYHKEMYQNISNSFNGNLEKKINERITKSEERIEKVITVLYERKFTKLEEKTKINNDNYENKITKLNEKIRVLSSIVRDESVQKIQRLKDFEYIVKFIDDLKQRKKDL